MVRRFGPAVDAREVAEPDKLPQLPEQTNSEPIRHPREIVARLRQKIPAIKGPAATTSATPRKNRQEALSSSERCRLILVVARPTARISNRLRRSSPAQGVKAQLSDLRQQTSTRQWLEGIESVGLTAGASAQRFLVEASTGRT